MPKKEDKKPKMEYNNWCYSCGYNIKHSSKPCPYNNNSNSKSNDTKSNDKK